MENIARQIWGDPRTARAELRGWGPDYTDVTIQCPVDGCHWENEWSDSIALGEVARVIGEHLASAHPE